MADIDSLREWLDDCPTPFHVVARAGALLSAAGFERVDSIDDPLPVRGWMPRDGAVVAWRHSDPGQPFRVIGAHTDSPNLRIHPRPGFSQSGWDQLGVEVYGGVLLNSWLDRDLGIAGRVVGKDGSTRLFTARQPLARVPQLAIHLDRDVNDRGLLLDRQQHLMPVWSTTGTDFRAWLGAVAGTDDIAAFDAHLYDMTPAAVLGADGSMLASARLDNQVSCWAAVHALIDEGSTGQNAVIILNDHEEVGSESVTGAAGPMLETVLEALCAAHGLGPVATRALLARSFCMSADNAHAVHPNYPERHEPRHAPVVNRGPALKMNGNQRYATNSRGAALMMSTAEQAGVPLQVFVSRNNMPCGSTIGPITATRLGIECIDVGVPQLSMHSARELCGADDPPRLVALMSAFLRG